MNRRQRPKRLCRRRRLTPRRDGDGDGDDDARETRGGGRGGVGLFIVAVGVDVRARGDVGRGEDGRERCVDGAGAQLDDDEDGRRPGRKVERAGGDDDDGRDADARVVVDDGADDG